MSRATPTPRSSTAGWSVRPLDVELEFWLTGGTAPIFNLLDANSPTADVSTVERGTAAQGPVPARRRRLRRRRVRDRRRRRSARRRREPAALRGVSSPAGARDGARHRDLRGRADFAQQFVFGFGRLDSCGAEGGPENLADRFKTPSLRGVAARPPYFHNGIAATLKDVVVHYEVALGFVFTEAERNDLVAFMEAL